MRDIIKSLPNFTVSVDRWRLCNHGGGYQVKQNNLIMPEKIQLFPMWFLNMLRRSDFSCAQLKTNTVFTLYLFKFSIAMLKAVQVERMHRLSSQAETNNRIYVDTMQ